MKKELFLNDTITLYSGDCIDVMKKLPNNSIDSVVTDPPYHLTSIVKRFGKSNLEHPADKNLNGINAGAFKRLSKGFMGKQWDGGDIAFQSALWAEVLRILKPGGYICSFGGTRTYHRMACAIEDAGFVTHPMIAWVFGTGFPKAHSVSKQIDKFAGVTREVVGKSRRHGGGIKGNGTSYELDPSVPNITIPATADVKKWDGWFYSTQTMKPAFEPIYLGQKPFSEKTGAANVLRWGTGAINIDGCRIPTVGRPWRDATAKITPSKFGAMGGSKAIGKTYLGRWPSNLCHDGSDEVLAHFPDSVGNPNQNHTTSTNAWFGGGHNNSIGYYDSGSAARFFYTAKASKDDRAGSLHPTVKPVSLIRWLVRLITPPNGIVLDCFAGSGTLGTACYRENFNCILIEKEKEYIQDIMNRLNSLNNSNYTTIKETNPNKNISNISKFF